MVIAIPAPDRLLVVGVVESASIHPSYVATAVLDVVRDRAGELTRRELVEWLEDLELAPTVYEMTCRDAGLDPLP